MAQDPSKFRVPKDSWGTILEELRNQGLEGQPSTSKTRIEVFGHPPGRLFLGTFTWVPPLGWRLLIASPTVRTRQDLELALDHLSESQKAIEAANLAWDDFSGSRTEKNWQAYLGVVAAHDLKLYKA